MSYRAVITTDPTRRGGKPCVRQTRITVYDVLGWLAAGLSIADILNDFPELTEADIKACLESAADHHRTHSAQAERDEHLSTLPSEKLKPDSFKTPIKSQQHLHEIEHPPPKPHRITQPFVWLEKRIWEPLLSWGENQALISLLGLLGNLGLVIAVLTYVGLEKQRRKAQVYLAWQTITTHNNVLMVLAIAILYSQR